MTVKLICAAPQGQGELIAAIIAETMEDAGAVSLAEAQGGGWRIEAYFPAAPDLAPLREILCSVIEDAAALNFKLENVPEEDWVAIAQRGLPPVPAGRFLIHGRHDRQSARARPYAIEIEAGRAFGTAHHGTTKGCLIAISDLAKARAFPSVLDLGTGSGVLAIAAARTLRARVLAVDIDPVAVMVARENCLLNGAAGRVETLCAGRLAHPRILARAPFDLIVANILAAPLIKLSEDIRHALSPGGELVLSGLLDWQTAEVWGRYRSAGFRLRRRHWIEGWATLVMQRR